MVLLSNKKEIPRTVRLKYRNGELIIKEGDYGISIYKIIKGVVEIFNQSDDRNITLTHLGPSEVFGETAFLTEGTTVRSASVRAVGDVEVEIWHANTLLGEFNEMPPMLKHITKEAVKRLTRMNNLVSQMTVQREDEKDERSADKAALEKRRHYRKKVDLDCFYSPVGVYPRPRLKAVIRNISLRGMRMDVTIKPGTNFSLDQGDEFFVEANLPNGKDIKLTAKILSIREPKIPGRFSLGMFFTGMREGTEKELGFYLMP
ncbi:Type IV pilus assembly protein [uncultured Desulfobacterium sp.]|uniref:Type IV pilus assembly protein n=1 Tax=uncultured Desulfobacterium sp. TaxID=201089 RepID=A0A445N360_9BACT|nr:Type IV pilus assembly protein [uncultured Desulfobacterium sp.]